MYLQLLVAMHEYTYTSYNIPGIWYRSIYWNIWYKPKIGMRKAFWAIYRYTKYCPWEKTWPSLWLASARSYLLAEGFLVHLFVPTQVGRHLVLAHTNCSSCTYKGPLFPRKKQLFSYPNSHIPLLSTWVCTCTVLGSTLWRYMFSANGDFLIWLCFFVDNSGHLIPIALWPYWYISFARKGFNWTVYSRRKAKIRWSPTSVDTVVR